MSLKDEVRWVNKFHLLTAREQALCPAKDDTPVIPVEALRAHIGKMRAAAGECIDQWDAGYDHALCKLISELEGP